MRTVGKGLLLVLLISIFSFCISAQDLSHEMIYLTNLLETAKKEMVILDYATIDLKLKELDLLQSEKNADNFYLSLEIIDELKALLTESRPVETRAVWLDDQALAKITSPSEMRNLVKWLNELNVNLILPSVYFAGESIYNSAIVPQSDWYRLNFPNEDPLEVLIDEAHKYGIEVHAWIMVYGLQGNIEPFLDRIDWLDRNKLGSYNDTAHTDYFFSPASPMARDHILSIIEELTNYSIDGIHLDNIRYKDGFGYGDYAVALYKEFFGIDPREIQNTNPKQYNHFREFKAQFIASFVERVRVFLHEKNPSLMLSAATAPGLWGKNSLGQDWHNWIDNRSLHFVLSMSYIETAKEYEALIGVDIDRIDGRTYVYPGMTLYSFTPNVMQEQWQVGQRAPITGQTLFSLLHIKPSYYQKLKDGLFKDKAFPTFREPNKAAILYLDWLKMRFEVLGEEAGLSQMEIAKWLQLLADLNQMIEEAPMRPYAERDLREEDLIERDYWLSVFSKIDSLLERLTDLEDPLKSRLTSDFLQLKSLLTPLEYTSRPFNLIPIAY